MAGIIEYIKRTTFVNILRKLYYYWLPPKQDLNPLLATVLNTKLPLTFVQIGAHNGLYDDNIASYRKESEWTCILVEPQIKLFRELQNLYEKDSKYILENSAISDEGGEKSLYKVAFTDEEWATGLASFNKEALLRSFQNGYVQRQAANHSVAVPLNEEDWVVEDKINSITLSELLVKHNLSNIDILVIDTEGYDFEIIKTIDFRKNKPSVIMFEYSYFPIGDLKKCLQLFRRNNYFLYRSEWDILAVDKNHQVKGI